VYVLAQRRKREAPAARRATASARMHRADDVEVEQIERAVEVDRQPRPAPERRQRTHGTTVRYEERPARTRRTAASAQNGARRRRRPTSRPVEAPVEPAAARRSSRQVEHLDDWADAPRRRPAEVTGRYERVARTDDRQRTSRSRQSAHRSEAPSRTRRSRDTSAAMVRQERWSSAV
jgi:hypothetical protein